MPRKPGRPPSETGKGRVRFIFEPDRTSPNGMTYSWLIHQTYNGKEKAATAVRAFWLPFAYQEADESTEAELKDLAQQSIWQMEAQIQHLRESFGLPVTPATTTTAPPTPLPETASAPVPTASSLEALTQDADLLDDFADVL